MDRIRFIGALSAVLLVSWANGGWCGRSPFPDPDERNAFQREELERRSRFFQEIGTKTDRDQSQDSYDAIYYRLALDLRDPDAVSTWIYGDLEADLLVVADSIETILFDLADVMQVDSVFVDGQPSNFTHEVYDLSVDLGRAVRRDERVSVRVYYEGHPRETGFFAFGWGAHNGTTLIWSLSEPTGAREWWPCKDRPDDKADSLDVILRVDDWMIATSNGLLVDEVDHGDGSKSFHWSHRYPITTYLVSVAATDYVRLEDRYVSADDDTLLLEHFVYPEHVSAAREDLSITPAAMQVMVDAFGPYPFPREKYGHSLFPFYGGMEHQTNTSYGGGLINGLHLYDWILVHELAHQWWGDKTSPADWRDIWLNEGFASYAEALWFESSGGFSDYVQYMQGVQSVYDPSGPIYDPPALFDSNTVYNKGAWAVHMLRGVLGDSLFFAVLDEYGKRTAYRSTTTDEFREIAEEIGGQDLDWYFEPWLYGMNRPYYSVSFLSIGEPAYPAAAIHLEQTQEGTQFPMPVTLEIQLNGGGFVRKRVWNDGDHEDYEFDLPVVPTGVIVDPDGWILKETATAAYGLNITSTDLPPAMADSAYLVDLVGRGGSPPYQWSAVGSLPVGLTLDPGAGQIEGVPPEEGTYPLEIRLTDAEERTDTQRFVWTVTASPDTIVDPPDTTIVGGSKLDLRVGPIPASSFVTFQIDDPDEGLLTLTIFDLQGRKIRELLRGSAPVRALSWDGRDRSGEKVASGIYLARLRSERATVTRRLLWLWGS